MRRGLAIFVILNIFIFGFLIHYVFTLITLLFEDCSADAIHSVDIPAPDSELIDQRPKFIPKIIHQTWANDSIPEKWKDAQSSCLALHADYEYKLWTNQKSRDFIAHEYPWFLETFDNYPYPIMRADAIRYFILAHYGGIYIDLDDGCQRRLDPLLSYHAWLRKTVPTGISNDAMGGVPQHPFFLKVIKSLQQYNRDWKMPYVTVMYNTGPLFLSVIWKEYLREVTTEETRVRILMPDEYNEKSWSFFGVYKGSSWHRGDAKAVFWMGKHWMFLTFAGVTLAVSSYFGCWFMYRRMHMRSYGYSSIPSSSWVWSRQVSGVGAGNKKHVKDEV